MGVEHASHELGELPIQHEHLVAKFNASIIRVSRFVLWNLASSRKGDKMRTDHSLSFYLVAEIATFGCSFIDHQVKLFWRTTTR